MWPGSSVSGLYFAHPQSRYFQPGQNRPRSGCRLMPHAEGHDRRGGGTLARAEPELRPRMTAIRGPGFRGHSVALSFHRLAERYCFTVKLSTLFTCFESCAAEAAGWAAAGGAGGAAAAHFAASFDAPSQSGGIATSRSLYFTLLTCFFASASAAACPVVGVAGRVLVLLFPSRVTRRHVLGVFVLDGGGTGLGCRTWPVRRPWWSQEQAWWAWRWCSARLRQR